MLVRDVMQSNVVTVACHAPVSEAAALMSRYRIRHLPVVSGARLVGLISDRDLKASAASLGVESRASRVATACEVTAGDLIRPGVVSVAPTATAEHAAELLAQHRIGSLPVVEGDELVGIVTATDLLALFARAARGGEDEPRQSQEHR